MSPGREVPTRDGASVAVAGAAEAPSRDEPFSQPADVVRRTLSGVDFWDRIAALIIASGAAAWLWLSAGGGLHLDDIRAQAYAADQPFWPFIVQSNKTHLSPGARTVDWLHSNFAPFEWWPAVAIITTVVSALGVVSWLALRQVAPQSVASLVGLFWIMFCPALIPGFAWYRQTLTVGVPVVMMLLATLLAIAAVRRNGSLLAVGAVAAHAVALCFSERAVLLPPVILVAFLVLVHPGRARPAWSTLRRGRPLFILGGMAVTNVAFLLAYRSGEFDDASAGEPTVLGLLVSTGRSLFLNTLPALLGGPLEWRRVLAGYSFADTPVAFAVPASGVVLAALLISLRRRRRDAFAARLGVVVLSYVLPLYALIYVGRISRDLVTSVDDLRLYNDVVVVVAIASAAALADLVGNVPPRGRKVRIAAGAIALIMALSAVSWHGWAKTWHATTTRDYFATAVEEVQRADGSILPTSFPDSVLPVYFQTDMSTANFVRLVNPDIETNVVSARPQLLDWSGRVVPADVRQVARPEAPSNFCGFRLAPGVNSLTITYDDVVPYQRSELVLLRLLAPDTMTLQVSVIDAEGVEHDVIGDTRPTLYRGPHVLAYQVPWQTRVAAVRVTPTAGHGGLCVTDAPVVVAVPR